MQARGGDQGLEQGYNRVGVGGDFGEVSLGPGDNPFIRVSDLVATSDGQYYVFSFDANEGGQAPKLLSIDAIRVYTRSSTQASPTGKQNVHPDDPTPLPNTTADLGNLGTLRWDMNGLEQNYAIVEAGGSGVADMFLFVPTANFAGAQDSDLVYLYAEHGGYTGDPNESFTATSGFEEWSIPLAVEDRPTYSIPEPSSLLMAGLGIAALYRRRRA